ncbi:hypothetical protein BH18ACI4_BH18ACI4_29620 [soil metagenome]
MSLCSLLNTSRKGVQAARIPGLLSSPADSLFPARKRRSAGFVIYALSTPGFKVVRDGSAGPVCACSARLLGARAKPDYRTTNCKTGH